MNNQMYCINGVRITTNEVMNAIDALVVPLLDTLPEDEDCVQATLQVTAEGWLLHTGDPSYIQGYQGYFGDALIFPDCGRYRIQRAAVDMLDTALAEYQEMDPSAFRTVDDLDGDDWDSVYCSQDIESILQAVGVGVGAEGITCVHARVGDGDYEELWVTDEAAPYLLSAEFWRVY
jgi:hypothetical protein